MKRIFLIFYATCLCLLVQAKELIIPFDTNDSPQETNSVLQLAYSENELILLRIDNTFPSQMSKYYRTITDQDIFGTTLRNYQQPKIGLTAKNHILEFASPKENKLISIKLNFQANTNYLVYFNDYQLLVKTDKGEIVQYENADTPRLVEPSEDQPHCLFESKNSGVMSKPTFLIYRIDDQITEKYNDKYSESPVIAFFGFPYSVKLAPGNHTILCKASYYNKYSLASYSVTFNFEEGKKYKAELVDFKSFKKVVFQSSKLLNQKSNLTTAST